MSSIRLPAALACLLVVVLGAGGPAAARADASSVRAPAAYADFAVGKRRIEGFFPLLIDPVTAHVYMEVPADRGEFIFQTSLPRGVGSNDLGLDRGQLGATRLVRFERIGTRMLLRQLNTEYRAESDNAAERAAVQEAFASSVLAGFDVVADDGLRAVIDYTPYLLTDTHDIATALADAKEGTYKVDPDRSAPFPDRTRNFPRNTELEAVLTLAGHATGRYLPTVTPTPDALTVHTHHSLIALPEPGYRPRPFDPFSGLWSFSWTDYAQPLDADLVQRVVPRHRLRKKHPEAARSEAVEPIVYYLDPGVPEPIRSALLQGAGWWNQAFEAIGYIDAFQVKMLPAGADPMDVRYNVIQWVHRSTRGWSYGASVRDPRTGEILKGHVTLGSLRVRQDLLIARALTAPFDADGDPAALDEMALARIRQLAAHEVGHTLGLAHNFAASAVPGGGSVMDYPHPRIALTADGEVDLHDAYGTGLGPWDLHAIAYGYSEFPPGQERAGLASILRAGHAAGLRYLSDPDARPADAAQPIAHLWDNGTDAATELRRLLKVREIALGRLGAAALRDGEPYSDLETLLAPVYYLHRYQVKATARMLGGIDYRYAVKGDGLPPGSRMVPAAAQNDALDALLETLSPQRLTLPPALIDLVLPQAYGWTRTRESPPGHAGLAFDAVTPAEAAAEQTLSLLFVPGRLVRMAQQHARDPAVPGVRALMDAVLAATVERPLPSGLEGEVARRVDTLVVEHLLTTAWGGGVPGEIAARARARLDLLAERLGGRRIDDPLLRELANRIERAAADGSYQRRDDVAELPPGSPI